MFSTHNFTTASLNHPDHPIFHSHPLYYTHAPTLIPLFSDPLLAILAPLPAYWLTSLLFHLFDMSDWTWLKNYRIHESAEVASRNRATRRQVLFAVLFQQALQTALGYMWISDAPERADHVAAMRSIARVLSYPSVFGGVPVPIQNATPLLAYLLYWWFIPAVQLLVAM
jgi:sphinganine C4-monooxygenase